MYKANKSFSTMSFVIDLVVFVLSVFTSPVLADENYGNILPDANMMMSMSSLESIYLPFDPNDFTFLIYESEGGERSIEAAMIHLGIPYDVRGPGAGDEVTSNDLVTHDILIVGWNANGNVSGLDEDILSAGITGRVILSGHDADYHTVHGPPAAEVFLVQAIDWVLKGGGTGMITLGCTDEFPYLPEEWDVNALPSGGEIVTEFTSEGLASGVYDGLDPYDMCNWGTSYHDVFTIDQDSVFVQFELGGDGDDIITVARLWPVYEVELTKTDDVNDGNSVLPGDYIMYTISYANPITDPCDPKYVGTLTDVNIVDYLPDEVYFISTSGPNATYDMFTNTVTWNIGTLEPNESNSVTLTVTVNNLAEPMGTIRNLCIFRANEIRPVIATEITDVNAWNPPVIYVDVNATGSNTGMTWDDACKDLQDALERAAAGCGTEIWVAAGTYRPSKRTDPNSYSATFQLVDGVPVYGGFAGNETSREQRNYVTNQTILNGDINNDGYNDGYNDARHVVTASNVGSATVIDGFTITKGDWSGLWCDPNSSPTIAHNTIKENNYDGVYCDGAPTIINCIIRDNPLYGIVCLSQSSPTITSSTIQSNGYSYGYSNDYDGGIHCITDSQITASNCIIEDNKGYGIYADHSNVRIDDCWIKGNAWCVYCSDSNAVINHSVIERNSHTGLACVSGSTLNLTNSVIRFNSNSGIYLENMSSATIKNNWIHNNAGDYGYGIYFTGQSGQSLVRNNSIIYNPLYGIYSDSSTEPDIVNCILYYNGVQIGTNDGPLHNVRYSCVQGDYEGTGNIGDDPNFFMYSTDPNDFHIGEGSRCIDTGDPNVNYDGETDIDGQPRVMVTQVDIGADEAAYMLTCDPNYDKWVSVGKPDCWCYQRQCYGDADGKYETTKSGKYYVHFNDLNLLLANWNVKGTTMSKPGICADFARDYETTKTGIYRVHFNDLNILLANWNVKEPPDGNGIPPDCLKCQRGLAEQQKEKVEPLKIEQMIKWLEQLWLDEETQKLIDKDAWLKLIESLKEELQSLSAFPP